MIRQFIPYDVSAHENVGDHAAVRCPGFIIKNAYRHFFTPIKDTKNISQSPSHNNDKEADTLLIAPYAMLYRNEAGETAPEWRKFQRLWVRPQILFTTLREGR
jgi:hypothetical protein